jgi:hypothetical protein
MFIFLNPPRPFWAIPDTDILLTRSHPFYELEEEELKDLSPEQMAIFNAGKESGVITEVSSGFVPKNFGKAGVDYIVTRPASEIQKRYVSKMIMAKDGKGLKSLRDAEGAKDRPRASVIQMIEYALRQISSSDEERFYNAIQEIEDDDGGKLELELEVEVEPTTRPAGNARTRVSRLN